MPDWRLDEEISVHLNKFIAMPKEAVEYLERMEPLQDKNVDYEVVQRKDEQLRSKMSAQPWKK